MPLGTTIEKNIAKYEINNKSLMNNITKTLSSKSELESKISPTHNTKHLLQYQTQTIQQLSG